jgi:3alpha(or 20beta)-hydroxysteroid dehydrogenase
MHRLDGKIAIITGAARGQGAAEATLFVAEGAKVVLADVRDDLGRELASALGPSALYVHHDVSNEASWGELVRTTERSFGPGSVLVNNAGIANVKRLVDETVEGYQRTVAVNQLGVFLGMREVVPSMRRARGGSIVNISSTGGIRGYVNNTAYGATKWAVRGMTKTAALELAPDNIRVNTILPGLVDTPILGFADAETMKAWATETPMARAGQPIEIARAALFLASDESSFMTGADVAVDGGVAI